MSFAAAVPWPVYLPEDRALGAEAGDLRDSLDMVVPPTSDDRATEAVFRLIDALRQAENRDGIELSANTFTKALEFMLSLPTDLPLPVVVVESEEEIGLDWDEDHQRVVSLTVDSSDKIGFSALVGREHFYGRVEWVNGLPETLGHFLARLYPSAQLV